MNREYYGASKGPNPESFETEVPVADFATIAGWYLAEGCVVYRRGIPNEVTFTLHNDERDAASEIQAALESFGLSARLEPVEDRNTLHLHVENASFAQFVDELFGTGASEKSVPDVLWQAPPNVQARVLESLFEGDGKLEKRGKSQRVQLKLTSEDVVDFVFQAGLRCGVQFSRHNREPDGRKRTYGVSASVSTALGTPLERLFDEVPDDFRATDRTKQANGREVVAVDSVETVEYDGPVYNAEVAGTHTYVAEDIVVHNCETIAQGGARRGAQMGVMRISHPDVIQFIHAKNKDVSLAETLRLNDPDDYTHNSFKDALGEARELIDDEGRVPKHLRNAAEGHLSNFNISVGVTDDFMEALQNDEEFTFTNPRTEEPHVATEHTKELYEMFGLGEYVEVGEELSIPADLIWDRIVDGAHENGEPGVIYLERVNKEHSFDVEEHPDHRILATNPCLTADMEVQLANGTTQPIGELATSDESVSVHTLNDGELVTRSASAFKTKEDVDVVRITTESGLSIRVTPDHEIRAENGEWVEASHLSAGDEIIGLSKPLATPHGTEHEMTVETVANVETDGTEDVYDLTVEDTHNFFASESGKEALNVHNCGEQPLEEYEACNLGHINLSTLADHDAPDWRVWYDEHGDEYDDFAEAVDAFLADAMAWDEFDHRIEYGTRFLENVVTMSDFPVEKIEQKVREMRKIGLGVMGLAQLYIQLGVEYGSEAGNEIARQLMRYINHESKWASHELAEERGSFDEWGKSKYADPTEYREWFEKQTGLNADDWAEGFPVRNHNTTTIAPTGTTSMVGNTTGGCEPIYNVAYYKNVSDDVQGDEMLVEFDDYFLRVLEDNDIDVEEVKREAQDQMANNVFDGVEGLETVPDAIGELFVVTSDLSGKEHAAVQCACQEGVDSAISKTCNFPNDASKDDMREVYEYIYENGGKGVTVYRDGTRSKQVLTTRADNKEFADESEAAGKLVEQIQEVFGGIEGFLDNEDVQAALDREVSSILEVADGEDADSPYASKRPRPDVLHGITQRIDTGYGKLYVNINEDDEGRPFELFANIGNSGGFTASFTEALAKTISTALRSGVDPEEIADELQGIRSPKVAWDKGEQINSIPDAIGTAMRRYLDGEVEKAYPQQQNLTEVESDETDAGTQTDGGERAGASADLGSAADAVSASKEADQQDIIDSGESPECPSCGSLSLYYSEGCKTCESCGWSEC
ncbi:LAGLIDADG family homing endonuclease [Halorussus caseinilyticus]|uniref:Vitamin B12-dependent ribonucleotide reductase n=1 Tax=Halorussus caseinilyticus TaxID=3034025 RepID=A0ABD5WG33_9EURY